MSKNKEISIALDYDGKSAPRVTAKGHGEVARKIIEIAEKHGVPIQQDEQLTAMLSSVELNEEIPPALYVAVAQLLAFLYHVNGMRPEDYHTKSSAQTTDGAGISTNTPNKTENDINGNHKMN